MTTTTDDFLVELKERITAPANQQLLDDAGFLRFADRVVKDVMVPMLLSVNQNFFVTPVSVPVVAGQEAYQIHPRAIARGLRELKMTMVGGTPNSTRNLTQIAIESEHCYGDGGTPTAFFFQGDWLVLRPKPINDNTYALQQFINMQPGKLVPTSQCAQISGISGNVLTCAQLPASFQPGVAIDLVQGVSGCSALAIDLVPTAAAGGQLTFDPAVTLPATLKLGDWVALAGQSPVIQLPDEVIPYMETMVAKRVLYAVSDFEGEQALSQTAAEQLSAALKILQPRAEGAVTKIVNRGGLLRGRGIGFRGPRNIGGFYS